MLLALAFWFALPPCKRWLHKARRLPTNPLAPHPCARSDLVLINTQGTTPTAAGRRRLLDTASSSNSVAAIPSLYSLGQTVELQAVVGAPPGSQAAVQGALAAASAGGQLAAALRSQGARGGWRWCFGQGRTAGHARQHLALHRLPRCRRLPACAPAPGAACRGPTCCLCALCMPLPGCRPGCESGADPGRVPRHCRPFEQPGSHRSHLRRRLTGARQPRRCSIRRQCGHAQPGPHHWDWRRGWRSGGAHG